jgi:hypothetical protein
MSRRALCGCIEFGGQAERLLAPGFFSLFKSFFSGLFPFREG